MHRVPTPRIALAYLTYVLLITCLYILLFILGAISPVLYQRSSLILASLCLTPFYSEKSP